MSAHVCPSDLHQSFKVSLETFIHNVRNVREQDSGDHGIRLLIGECRRCPSTLGFELEIKVPNERSMR